MGELQARRGASQVSQVHWRALMCILGGGALPQSPAPGPPGPLFPLGLSLLTLFPVLPFHKASFPLSTNNIK